MAKTNNNRTLFLFLLLMLVFGIFGLYSFHTLHKQHIAVTKTVKEQQYKNQLIRLMTDAARQRAFIIFKMTLSQDVFELDDLHQEFNLAKRIYIKHRLNVNDFKMTPKERALFETQETLSSKNAKYFDQLTEYLAQQDSVKAKELLSVVGDQGHTQVIDSLNDLNHYYASETNKSIAEYSHFVEKSGYIVKVVGAGFYFFLVTALFFLFKRVFLQKDAAFKKLYEKQVVVVEQLQLSEKKLKNFINSLSTFTGVLNLEGQIEILNKVPARADQNKLKQLIGSKFCDCIWWSYDEHIKKQLIKDIKLASKGRSIQREVDILVEKNKFIKVQFFIHPVFDDNGEPEYLVIEGQDITERSDHEQKLNYQASHDVLTGLTNRHEFEIELQHVLSNKNDDISHAVLYLDLDSFKIINDTCGHVAGDELLRQIPALIESNIRASDTVSRLGGDEFGVILKSCDIEHAKQVSNNIIGAFNDFVFLWEDHTFRVGVSIGILMIQSPKPTLEDVVKKIDAACYAAKDTGRNRYYIYTESDESMQNQIVEMSWVSRIEDAVLNDGFVLYAQPIISLNDNEKSQLNYEFLVRMQEKDGTLIPPGAFLPAAERYNKIIGIDRWVINEAFKLLANHPKFVESIGYCSINLSSQVYANNELIDFIHHKFQENIGLENKICFEITETDAITNLTQAQKIINKFQKMGVRFALDDFGSGISSFGYLKNLPIDLIKIDGMFVKDIMDDPVDFAMVQSIHQMATVMGKETIAEFVENEGIALKLREIGVTYGQGYGLGIPRNTKDIVAESEN